MADINDPEMQISSAPTIYNRRAPEGGALDAAAAAAADIVPDQGMSQGTGPRLADGMTLVDPRISNKHFSPC